MKLLKALAAIVITTTLMSMSCSKTDDNSGGNNGTAGSWRVTTYWDKKDETSKFAGYSFDFHAGGHLQATKAGIVYDGSWSETSSRLIISFGTLPVLSDLNDDWVKENITPTTMKLKDDNPTSDEWVQFTRN